jgi:hypothetical protein
MRASVASCTFALLTACVDESVLEPAFLEHEERPFMLDVPAPVTAGVAVTVTITSYGSSCTSAYSTGVASDGETFFLTPFDVRSLSDGDDCNGRVQSLAHAVELVFETPGSHTVRVHGRKLVKGVATEIDRDTDVVVE